MMSKNGASTELQPSVTLQSVLAEVTWPQEDLKSCFLPFGRKQFIVCDSKTESPIAHSMGMSSTNPGLPHNNQGRGFRSIRTCRFSCVRNGKNVGCFAGRTRQPKVGLLGVSGLSGDVRDLEEAADKGDTSGAQLALDLFVAAIRQYLGGFAALY